MIRGGVFEKYVGGGGRAVPLSCTIVKGLCREGGVHHIVYLYM